MAKMVAGQASGARYQRPPRPVAGPEDLGRGENRAEREEILLTALGLTNSVEQRAVVTPAGQVALLPEQVRHIVAKPGDHRERFANRIIPTLREPDEIWRALYDNGQYRWHFIKAWDDRKGTVTIVAETRAGAIAYNFIPFNAGRIDRWRGGVLLYPSGDAARNGEE